jgi:hypothetical protein
MKFLKFEEGAVTLNKDVITLYPLVKKILAKDKGGKIYGDPDGRLKMYAMRELAYVYFMCDFEAYPVQHGLNEKEAHKYAVKNSPLDKEYQPDDIVLAFMKQYEAEHLTPTKRTIKTLIRVFTLNEKLVEKIEANLNASLDLPVLNSAQIAELLGYQKQLMSIAVDVPKTVKELRNAMSLLEEEEKIQQVIRGGEIKPDSYDSNNDIEK